MIKVKYERTEGNGYVFTLLNNTIIVSAPERKVTLQPQKHYDDTIRFVPSSYIADEYTIEINGVYRSNENHIGRGIIERGFKKANSIQSAKRQDKSTEEIVNIITSSKYNEKAKTFLNDDRYYIYEKENINKLYLNKFEDALHLVFIHFESYLKAKEHDNFKESESIDDLASEYGFEKISSLLNHVKYLQDIYKAFEGFSEDYEEDIIEICSEGSSKVLKKYLEIENVTK